MVHNLVTEYCVILHTQHTHHVINLLLPMVCHVCHSYQVMMLDKLLPFHNGTIS